MIITCSFLLCFFKKRCYPLVRNKYMRYHTYKSQTSYRASWPSHVLMKYASWIYIKLHFQIYCEHVLYLNNHIWFVRMVLFQLHVTNDNVISNNNGGHSFFIKFIPTTGWLRVDSGFLMDGTDKSESEFN